MSRRNRLVVRPRIEFLEGRTVLAANTPAALTAAYGLNAITFPGSGGTVRGDGTGQTIAIVDAYHDANLAAEVAGFDAQFGLPAAALTVDDLAGSAANTDWSEEEAMDVEWAHAIAPGATLVVVEAASASITDLLAGVAAARQIPGVSAVSMSWGTAEFSGETADDALFTTPAGHTGITFLAATGDNGPGAQWPASSPNVVAVGGTSLTVTTAGNRAESAWANSGGGSSSIEAEPTFQAAVQATGHRGAPDVAFDADPTTGVAVDSVAGGGWIQMGGTSLGAPAWAALLAIANQGRALAGRGTLDGATQTLGDLYEAPAGSFADVTTGPGAAPGYDFATGLGTPNGATLIAALAADPAIGAATMPTPVVPTMPVSSPTTTNTPTMKAMMLPTAPIATTTTTTTTTTPTTPITTGTTARHTHSAKHRPARAKHATHADHEVMGSATERHAVDAVLAGWHRGGRA